MHLIGWEVCFTGHGAACSAGVPKTSKGPTSPALWPRPYCRPALQDEALDQVKAILGCNTTTARALLIFFNWDTEAVLGEWHCGVCGWWGVWDYRGVV